MNRIVVSGFLTGALLLGVTGCSKSQDPSTVQAQAGDPANGNLAAPDQSAPPPDQTADTPPAPAYSQAPAYAPADNSYADANYDASSDQSVYATEPPPPLPEYAQPPCPGDDYIWTPGYWGWQNTGYYWVPGVWVTAPYVDALWTPPYWGFVSGRYLWHRGYWGPHIGFYGGVDYGFGYTGHGYYGAYWNNGRVYYNRSVTNVNVSVVRNVYNYSVPAGNRTRVSYNGGRGGIDARPLPAEQAALREPHQAPVAAQAQHMRQAASNREQFAAVNRGRPQVAAATAPLATPYRTPAPRPAAVSQALARPNPGARPVPENRAPEARGPEARGQFQPGARPGAAPAPAASQPFQRAQGGQPNRPVPATPENRIAGRPPQPAAPAPAARQPFENRATPQPAPAAREPFRENRPAQPAPAARQPVPENRPTPQPAPVTRQPVPQNRPAPQQPQQRFEARPAAPAPQPRQEARPAPQPAARPAAVPAPRPTPPPAARPAPQPAARPAPGRPAENKEKR